MISKAKQRLIKSLQSKKIRQKHQSFLVQGEKAVVELLNSSLKIHFLLATKEFLERHQTKILETEVVEALSEELNKMGTLEVNDQVIAVVETPSEKQPHVRDDELILLLDSIRDPGNLGTIIRTADWFGVTTIVASKGTVDFFNPKVINATMGSFTRVNLLYTELDDFIRANPHITYLGADMMGDDATEFTFTKPCAICLGSESHGLSENIKQLMHANVSVRRVGKAESLNVAIAAGILMQLASK